MRGAAVSTRPGAELEVLADGEASEDLAPFGDLNETLADDLVGWRRSEVEVAETRNAGVWPQQARQGIEDGRLAGTVGADEGDDLPPGDTERDAAHRLDRAVGNLEIAHVEQGRGGFGGDRRRGGRHVHLLGSGDVHRRLLRLASEVRRDYRGVLRYRGWRAIGNLSPEVENGDVAADTHHQPHVVVDEQHGQTILVELLDQGTHAVFLGRGHSGGGLIEDQQVRIERQRAADPAPA